MKKIIKITCEAKENIKLEKFHEIQGGLKELSKEGYDQLKKSILERGFTFPYFCWKDSKNKHWIIDAHSRNKVLINLQKDGYIIPPLPTAFIHAKNKREAKEKLLLANSNYGKVTDKGFHEFINEKGAEINIEEISPLLDIPNIDLKVKDIVNMVNGNDDEWVGMPDFEVKEESFTIIIHFDSEAEREAYATENNMQFVKKQTQAWSTVYPFKDNDDLNSLVYE